MPLLIFSGGPGGGAIDEPEAMTRYAARFGVPETAVIADPAGVNAEATVLIPHEGCEFRSMCRSRSPSAAWNPWKTHRFLA